MLKIGFCGAHGTGKTTLVNILAPELGLNMIEKTMRNAWSSFGVNDFEQIPKDARTVFQNYLILKQIEKEDESNFTGFVADRTVLDILAYTVLNTDMQNSQFQIFEKLVIERLKNYTHFVYTPIEFEVQKDKLRANLETREKIDQIIVNYLEKWLPKKYLKVFGSVENRLQQIRKYTTNT